MNRSRNIIVILIPVILILGFLVYNYLISIYEVIYKVIPGKLYADNKSEVTITAVPVNALGFRALFREAGAVYKIIEGNNLIEILENNEKKGILRIKAKDRPGVVEITAKSPYALLPSPINIQIYSNMVEVLHEVNGII